MADAEPHPRSPDATEPKLPRSAPANVDLTGHSLGDFQILRKLGSGGMGQVYLARQLSLKRDVAVKLLRNDLAANVTALKRFEAEAHAVARVNHPNIVQVYHLGEYDGLRYMVLEYVDGRNLRDYLVRRGPPDLPVTLSVIRQVAMALQKAHEQGIVHRDIKPENILVTRKVEVKVTDFGLSRFFTGETPALNLTQSGVTLGTPLYMSPEQVQGGNVDHRSDIYSFGITCYHLLAGEPPFRGQTAFDVAMKHVHESAKPLVELRSDLPADLCAMVHKMIAKNPADRYQSAREILRDLARVREGIGLGLTQIVQAHASASTTIATPANASSVVLSLSGSTSGEASVPSGSTMAIGTAVMMQRPRWGPRLMLLLGCVLAVVGGAVAYGRLHSPGEVNAADSAGLPDIRPPVPPTLTRERELLELLKSRETPTPDVVAASIELGLLYVREGKLKEAEARFKKLENERFPAKFSNESANWAGKLGQAIVLAYQDKPSESNTLFLSTVPKSGKLVVGPPPKMREFRDFLFTHPALSQAISDALNRNLANLNSRDKEMKNPILEQLRQARELSRPMKDKE